VAGVGSFSRAPSEGATSQCNEGCLCYRCYLQKSTTPSSVNAYTGMAHPRCNSVSNCSQMRFFGASDICSEGKERVKMRLRMEYVDFVRGLDFGGRKSDELMGN
jgi:hypothetical protein